MRRFEYRTEEDCGRGDWWLNSLGSEGWQLMHVTPATQGTPTKYLFMREAPVAMLEMQPQTVSA
jgi:hypothetical protein